MSGIRTTSSSKLESSSQAWLAIGVRAWETRTARIDAAGEMIVIDGSFGSLVFALLYAVATVLPIAALVLFLAAAINGRRQRRSETVDPMRELQLRFARGEVDDEEFARRRDALLRK